MRPSTQEFLRTFGNAYSANWPYVVVRRTSAALQCLELFATHGLVHRFGPLPAAVARLASGGPRRRGQRLLVWLQPWPATAAGGGTEGGRLQRRGGDGASGASGRGSHRLQLERRPSRRHAAFLGHRELRRRYPAANVVAILETPRGIVTSREALRHRLGGWLLATLHLLP